MSVQKQVISTIIDILQLNKGLASSLNYDTVLLGAIPEFDSMAVVSILTAFEEHYGFFVDDDEIDADIFQTIGTLTDFVELKINQ